MEPIVALAIKYADVGTLCTLAVSSQSMHVLVRPRLEVVAQHTRMKRCLELIKEHRDTISSVYADCYSRRTIRKPQQYIRVVNYTDYLATGFGENTEWLTNDPFILTFRRGAHNKTGLVYCNYPAVIDPLEVQMVSVISMVQCDESEFAIVISDTLVNSEQVRRLYNAA
jgi:hypothetical protein